MVVVAVMVVVNSKRLACYFAATSGADGSDVLFLAFSLLLVSAGLFHAYSCDA